MMAESEDKFNIIISKNELLKLKQWGEWARANGMLDHYLVVLKTIDFRLSFEPLEWGEPRFTLQHMGLTVCFGTFKMLNVWYGVNEESRKVYVRVFQFRGDYAGGKPPD